MINNKALLLLAFVVFALIFSVLTVLFWSFMNDTILVPIYYFLWVIGLLVSSVPQGVYLTLLVILSVIIGAKTLESPRTGRYRQHVVHDQSDSGARYLHWRILCTYAYGNWFSKGQLALEAYKLILSILAFEQGVSRLEAETMVRNGALDVPDVLRNFIESKRIPDAPFIRFTGMLSRLRHPTRRARTSSDPNVDQFLAELISFVEHHLEITPHVGNKS